MTDSVDRMIGSNVRLLRKKNKMRLVDLVDALARSGHPIPMNALSKLELGTRSISASDLIALAYTLDVSIDQLIQSRTCPTCGQAVPPQRD